ncbi:MAG: DEAD/DEAH box helicase [Bacteroidetes bacterium]|nr:DEAD/DEAH box helicase [Bacteroidota bacterium]
MLPLQQAYEVKYSILEYLKATFSFKDKTVHEAFYNFINDNENGIFKGPYISLKLPFVKAEDKDYIPLVIKPNFPPYDHQLKAFKRLTNQNGHTPKSTLITTGTSSGKTECFMYPILDYCYNMQHKLGIKVIILYPMNALATDQAKRLAETIWNDERLKGKITAGLFIGEGKDKKKFPKDMGFENIIENRQSIVDSPPDILLTNFKMLDYSLMRNTFHNLWNFNINDTTLLQYIVLDELHTYDGAQGTDVANLIRRLKLKLKIEKGQICAVGTSATMGSGEDSTKLLIEYAEKVYGESFDNNSIITEHRLNVNDFFDDDETLDRYIPRQIGLVDSRLAENETYSSYIQRQKRLWQIPEAVNETQLGEELKKLKLVKDLVSITNVEIKELRDLLKELADLNHEFKRLSEWDSVNEFNPREEIINSILALISEAKTKDKKKSAFLYLQIQIWIRELSGVLRELSEMPKFVWKDAVGDKKEPKAMPSYFCRECGSSGWLMVKDDNKNFFSKDPSQVYDYFFSNHKNIYFTNTINHKHVEEYEPNIVLNDYLNVIDLSLSSNTGENQLRIHSVRKLKENKARHICPECNTENTIGIIGTRVATLSSITISQILSSDLDPRHEKYRKILAFTNSVQDAAHQAGFVEARNYRFTFRSSLQKVINILNKPVSLNELQEEFIKYWKTNADPSGENNEEAYFYRFLPDDYKGKVDLANDFKFQNKFSEEFKHEFDLRIKWEVASEFGYNALIGRTLEKTGASATKFDEEKLKEVYPKIKDWLFTNDINITEAELMPFINGMLHRIRTRGGIDNEYFSKFRSNKLELRDLNWWQDSRHFLNKNFGMKSRLPKLITNESHSKGMLDFTHSTSNTWFKNYFSKSFQNAQNYNAIVNDFYSELLDTLTEVGILNKVINKNNNNYAILPESIIIENKVKCHECNSCASKLNVAESDNLTVQTNCLDYTCKSGIYFPKPPTRPNYYQLVYNRNRSPRIYAAEHTGLLERKDRENKETDFKERPKFNSLNTIVATSTLEMGIDIGTLNTAINNSIPPLTSNFLQRVGRAGRSTGTALITNFAQSKPHDLFYYQEPSDMMDGEIATPGCYLEAKDILFRHFFAFCLDNWSSDDPKNHSIPSRLITLRLLTTDLNTPDFFPNRIISYIKSKENEFLNRFNEFYKPDLEDIKVLELLREYLLEESFYNRLRKVFEKLKAEYQYIFEKRYEIDESIKINKLAENDDERKTLESEKKALWGLKRLLDKRSLLEHLTNVGMLPNYAFPETGVTLNAWVKDNQAKGSNSIPRDHQFEIVRSSNVAIREFAPDNHFYSQGYKFDISGINTFDWKDTGTLIEKRFCSNCDNIEIAVKANEITCPKCGDSSWSSVKNKHIFVRLNGVKSANTRDKATLDDSSDDRDSSQYKISKHIKFDDNSFQGAWGMKDIPFGIEYVKNADIQIVNLGLFSTVDANKISINNIENVPYHGFVTCKHCGKSSSEPHKARFDKNFKFHYGYCKYKNILYQGHRDEVFEEVYLFKEMKTEALKVLLPVQDFDGEAQVKMFKAGLELGLKKYYKGNPQHISILDYLEYNVQNSRFDRYLVIHDNIAGGTGYLEKLFNPVEFTEVITKAYQAIKECSCQHNGKDGCYRCIFTYSNQSIQNELSRSVAEKLFKKIVDKSSAWERYNSGINKLTGNGQIEESELEDRFIRSLRNHIQTKEIEGWLFEDFIQDGVVNYKFRIKNGNDSYSYFIRPQVELGKSDGISYRTRTDFYITLTSININGQPIEDISVLSSFKDIAIYLDGYTYHATKENQRFFNDLQKRNSIVNSGNKLSWTLTWDDLERFDSTDEHSKKDNLALTSDHYNTMNIYKNIPYWMKFSSEIIQTSNSMDRLIWLLSNPKQDQFVIEKTNLYLSLLQIEFGKPSVDEKEIENYFLKFTNQPETTQIASNRTSGQFYVFPEIQINELNIIKFTNAIKLSDLKLKSSLYVDEINEAINKETWEKFWQIYNLTQQSTQIIFGDQMTESEIDKYECLKYHDVELHSIVKQFIDNNFDFEKEGGFFLPNGNGFAEAMLGSHEYKFFINPLSEVDRQIFLKSGFIEIEPAKFNINNIQ